MSLTVAGSRGWWHLMTRQLANRCASTNAIVNLQLLSLPIPLKQAAPRLPEFSLKQFRCCQSVHQNREEDKSVTKDILCLLIITILGISVCIALKVKPHVKISDIINRGVLKLFESTDLKTHIAAELESYILSGQGPNLRDQILQNFLQNPETEAMIVQWVTARLEDVFARKEVITAMGEMLMAAMDLPTTKSAVAKTLAEVLNRSDTKLSALDFVISTLSEEETKQKAHQLSRDVVESIANDPEVQSTLWAFFKKTLLPKWINGENPKTVNDTDNVPLAQRLKLTARLR